MKTHLRHMEHITRQYNGLLKLIMHCLRGVDIDFCRLVSWSHAQALEIVLHYTDAHHNNPSSCL